MKCLVGAAVVSLLLSVVAAPAFGAERGAVPKDVLEQLEFMAGKWQEQPGAQKAAGSPDRTLVHRREWVPGKHCLIVTWSGLFDGVKVDASGIVGWSRTKNQVTEHWYLSDGTYLETCYPVAKMTDSTWGGTTSWVEADGRRITGTCQLKKKGKDTFVWTAELKDGDKVMRHEVTNRRLPD